MMDDLPHLLLARRDGSFATLSSAVCMLRRSRSARLPAKPAQAYPLLPSLATVAGIPVKAASCGDGSYCFAVTAHVGHRRMKAVILAGGIRSGHELPGCALPRALWPFPDDPLISAVIRFLRAARVGPIAVCANGKTPLIASTLAAAPNPWPDLHYSQDHAPRGPAGCLKDLEAWLGDEPFIVAQGTAFYQVDLPAMMEAHQRHRASITVGAALGAQGPGHLTPAGLYVVEPHVLRLVAAQGYQDIKEQLLPRARAAGHIVRCHLLCGRTHLIHGVAHYLDALEGAIARAGRSAGTAMQRRGGDLFVHPSAQIHPHARMAGSIWIGPGARVDADAVMVGPVLLGPDSHVGCAAVMRRSVLLPQGVLPAGVEVADQILSAPAPVSPPVLKVPPGAENRPRRNPAGWAGEWVRRVRLPHRLPIP